MDGERESGAMESAGMESGAMDLNRDQGVEEVEVLYDGQDKRDMGMAWHRSGDRTSTSERACSRTCTMTLGS